MDTIGLDGTGACLFEHKPYPNALPNGRQPLNTVILKDVYKANYFHIICLFKHNYYFYIGNDSFNRYRINSIMVFTLRFFTFLFRLIHYRANPTINSKSDKEVSYA